MAVTESFISYSESLFFCLQVRMYQRYSERSSWKFSLVSCSEVRRFVFGHFNKDCGIAYSNLETSCSLICFPIFLLLQAEHGGYKTCVMEIKGNRVYSKLKYESGVHRVQRVPQTETQGRVHTSTATVAIMPEVHFLAFFFSIF